MGAATPETARDSSMADLVEHASEGIFFVADVARRFTYVNIAVCRMLGYSREELLGRPLVELLPAAEEDSSPLAAKRAPERGRHPAREVDARAQGRDIHPRGGERRAPVRWQAARLRSRHHRARAPDPRSCVRPRTATHSPRAAMPDSLFRFDKELRFVEVLAARSLAAGATSGILHRPEATRDVRRTASAGRIWFRLFPAPS